MHGASSTLQLPNITRSVRSCDRAVCQDDPYASMRLRPTRLGVVSAQITHLPLGYKKHALSLKFFAACFSEQPDIQNGMIWKLKKSTKKVNKTIFMHNARGLFLEKSD